MTEAVPTPLGIFMRYTATLMVALTALILTLLLMSLVGIGAGIGWPWQFVFAGVVLTIMVPAGALTIIRYLWP